MYLVTVARMRCERLLAISFTRSSTKIAKIKFPTNKNGASNYNTIIKALLGLKDRAKRADRSNR